MMTCQGSLAGPGRSRTTSAENSGVYPRPPMASKP